MNVYECVCVCVSIVSRVSICLIVWVSLPHHGEWIYVQSTRDARITSDFAGFHQNPRDLAAYWIDSVYIAVRVLPVI